MKGEWKMSNANLDVVSVGEVLWDVIEGVPHLGGAPFNFAAHCALCGLKTAMISSVGDDDLGRRAYEMARGYGVDITGVAVHPKAPTGTVLVTLKDGIPSYDICRNVAWDEIVVSDGFLSLPCPRAVYFGTLVQRAPVSAAALKRVLDTWKDAEMFFDVNLRQDYWSKALVEEGLGRTTVLKLNDEEQVTLGIDPTTVFAAHPRLKVVIVTKGADGCEVFLRDGTSFVSPAQPAGPVVDTVGAGDAFSAAFLTAYLKGATPQEAAQAGNVRGGFVASKAGAIPVEL